MLWPIAAFFAYLVKGLCGFADTLIFSGILSFVHPISMITPVSVLTGYPTNVIILARERKLVRPRTCLPIIIPLLLGEIPGIFLLSSVNTTGIKIIFGLLIMVIGARMLFSKAGSTRPLSPAASIGWGILSGIVCGMFGVGVMAAASVSRIFSDPQQAKANTAFVFLFDTTFRLIMYAATGLITSSMLLLSISLWPFMVGSVLLGMWIARRMSVQYAARLIQIMLIISGAALVITNL